MLFLARLVTMVVFFCLLGVALYVAASIVMGAVAGAQAASEHHATGVDAFRLGQAAGQEVGRRYGTLILLCSVGVSAAVSGALAFGGAFPWCRRRYAPPPLPGRFG